MHAYVDPDLAPIDTRGTTVHGTLVVICLLFNCVPVL